MATMMRIGRGALLAVAVMAVAVFGTASAASYDVGDQSGWTIRHDYANWASSKKFQIGDQIVFKYMPYQHNVLEVSKADYDSCSTSNPIATHNPANGTVPIALTSAGTRYFICGLPSHCGAFLMKVQIDVASSSGSSPVPAAGGPSANSPPSPSASAATSVGAAAGFGLAVLLADFVA